METKTLKAPNISCMHCVGAIKRAVGKLDGVSEVEGNPTTREVTVTFDPARVDLAKIKDAMAEEGYPAAN
ncbi:MAG TPA: heavy-metal-associated domain-containing protein [Chloroflexota bacterium]|nr:heavy-metal-associated domain-containing protein [Chloroflexota bacterium]